MRNQLLLSLALALGLGAFLVVPIAHAQEPLNTSPANAVYLDNQWHYVPASTTLWYVFDYNGDRSIIELVLADGNSKKLQFNLYTPGQISGQEDGSKPIGRGSAPMVNCPTGRCPSNHILWKGAFNAAGTYMVEVINPNQTGMPYFLGIVGGGVTLRVPPPSQPQPLSPPTPAVPSVAPTPSATVSPTSPGSSVEVLDSGPITVSASSQLWLSFDAPAGAKIDISLPGGADSSLLSFLFAQDLNAPNSVGSLIGTLIAKPIPCTTGTCPSHDLGWTGELAAGGTYMVQVINNNPSPQTFNLVVVIAAPGTSP